MNWLYEYRSQEMNLGAFIFLNNGKLLITPNHCYMGSSKIDLASSIPSGIIAMWSGASDAIPTGWLLCNGENNTPDLRNRFIVGAGSSYSVGNTGGSDSVTLTTEQMPSHNHEHTFQISLSGLTCSTAGRHTHTYTEATSGTAGYTTPNCAKGLRTGTTSADGSHKHDITGDIALEGSISNTGSGGSHENRPPYYALCFIMKE